MSKNIKFLLSIFFAFIVIVIGNHIIVAQTSLTGTWKSNDSDWNWNRINKNKDDDDTDAKRDSKDKINLNFSYETSRGGTSNNGQSYNYSELQGLTRAQVENGGQVNFRIVREAGTIDCTGSFQNGKGAGTFRFTANPQFISAMKSRGFDFEAPSKDRNGNVRRENDLASRLFAAATINVTTALADDLKSANFPNLGVDDLFKAAIFKVDSKFMREMAATGFPNLSMEDLVKARIFKIDAAFVRNAVAMGFVNKSFEDLVKLSIFKVTPEYMRDMQAAGFSNISAEEAVKLRIFKVTPEFIKEMKAEGLNNLSVEEATKLRIFNIDAAFVRKAKADNVPVEVEKLVQRRIGVWKTY